MISLVDATLEKQYVANFGTVFAHGKAIKSADARFDPPSGVIEPDDADDTGENDN